MNNVFSRLKSFLMRIGWVTPMLAVVVFLGWLATAFFYRLWTDNLSVYAPQPIRVSETERRVDIGNYYYLARLNNSGGESNKGAYQFSIFLDEEYVGSVSLISNDGLGLAWNYSPGLWDDIEKLYGVGEYEGSAQLYEFVEPFVFKAALPFSRDLIVEVPPGSINALVKSIVRKLSTKNPDEFDIELNDAFADRLAHQILTVTSYGDRIDQLQRVSFFSGPIQFLTFWLFVIACVLLVLGSTARWSKRFGDQAVELIPYFGFFGTLYGMSGALKLMGDTDLTSGISKAVTLGPVGSLLSLAVQTTMFALVLYLAASFVSMMMDAAISRQHSESAHTD